MTWTTMKTTGKKPWILTRPMNDGYEEDELYSFATKKQRTGFIAMLRDEGRLTDVVEG